MIINNLSAIMGRKRIKKAEVEKATKISRPTLTALYYGHNKGINLDTMNRLCAFLSVTPGDLFTYYAVDIDKIDVNIEDEENFSGKIKFVQDSYTDILFVGTVVKVPVSQHGYDLTISIGVPKEKFYSMFPDETVEEQVTDELIKSIWRAYLQDVYMEFRDVTFLFPEQK